MQKQDLFKVYTIAKSLWANFKIPETDLEAPIHDQVWFELLKFFSLDLITASMLEYSKESEWCNIGKIAQKCQDIATTKNTLANTLTEQDVYIEIHKAVLKGDYYEDFKTLSDVAKKVVGHPKQLKDWAYSSGEAWETVTKSHILRAIRNILAQKQKIDYVVKVKKRYSLPSKSKELLDNKEIKLLEQKQ